MLYNDRVFGKVIIGEPVILDLINSPALQRLKDIDQAGYMDPYFPGAYHSRFEHSFGDYLLLRKFNASLEEQIAGLIHDVSHSAFSHCTDYALNDETAQEQKHQDNIFREFVLRSGIPSILEKHKIDVDYILDDRNFPLQEKELPDLCADRIDYSLRGLLAFGEGEEKDVINILDNLEVIGDNWVFQDMKVAQKFADYFYLLNKNYYASLWSAVMFKRVSNYLKHALDKQYISKKDLHTTDKLVMKKINKNLDIDYKLQALWKGMNNSGGFENNKNNYDELIVAKSRIVDPLVKCGKILKRVSEINPRWKSIVEEESKPKEYYIKFID